MKKETRQKLGAIGLLIGLIGMYGNIFNPGANLTSALLFTAVAIAGGLMAIIE